MPFKKTTLDNGLRIITVPEEDSLTTTVLVLVEAGSKYETKEINGLSHFLEHMYFKGTKKRPRSIDIASELDGIGAAYNAFTSMEWTGYFAKVEPKHLDTILDVVSDMYLNPLFGPAEIEKEKGVIIEEINLNEDIPTRRIQKDFVNLLYGDQPAGWDIAGRKEVIQKLTRDDFLKYRSEHYLAKATVVVISGNFNEEETLDEIRAAFAEIAAGKKIAKIGTTEHQEQPEILLSYKATDQTHLVLGARTFSIFDKRRYALEVLSDILGGGMSSRLWQRIREQMGAAYYVHASSDLFTDHGYLAAAAGVDNTKLSQVIAAIVEEFKKLKEIPLESDELQRAKDHLVGNLFLGLETSDAIANFYGGQEIVEKQMISPEELAGRIQSVSQEEVMAVAKDIFHNQKLNLAIIGPSKDEEALRPLLKID